MSIDAANIAQRDQLSAAELQQLVETEQNALKVQQLRLQVSEARRAAHWSELQREFEIASRAVESVYDGFTPDVVDPLERWHETRDFHGIGMAGGWPAQIEDTKDGHYRPFWQTLAEYRDLMGLLRDIAKGHELGETIAQKVVDYVVHTGFTHAVEPKNAKDLSDATQAAADAAQGILDEFHRRTKWRCHREANFVAETIQFGEQLVWIRHAGDGKAELVDVPLEQIAEPQPKYQATLEEVYGLPPCSWTYGVATREDDTSKVVGFFWDRDHTGVNYDFIPIAEAMWIKVNTPDQVKRGMSDFYPLLPLMKISKPLLRNVGVQAAIQASIAYIREQDKNAGGTGGVTAYGPSGGALVRSRSRDNLQTEVHRPGAIHDTNGVAYHASPMGNSQAGEYINVHDAILRIMGQRWEMPEYLISGVADTANKSTTEDSSEPWYRRVERTQVFFASYFTEADRRVLAIAIDRGRLADVGILSMDEFDALLQVTVKGAPTKRSRPEDEIDGDLGLVDAKVMSRQTHREKLNLNHDVEERRIAEETAQDLERQQQRMELENAMRPQPESIPGQTGFTTESVLEHQGPGNHPSGSPQSVHAVKNGEKKWQAANRKSQASTSRAELLDQIADKARRGIKRSSKRSGFEDAALSQIRSVLQHVPTNTLQHVAEKTAWSLHDTRPPMIAEADQYMDASSYGFGGMVAGHDGGDTPGAGGTVILDGDHVGSHNSYSFMHLYAHEIGHAVELALPSADGKWPADSDEWVSAWKMELADGQLSGYAATDPVEGWAEMFAFATNGGYDAAVTKYPASLAALVRIGALKYTGAMESDRMSSQGSEVEFHDVLAPCKFSGGRADAWKDAGNKQPSIREAGNERQRLTEAAALIWADYPGGAPDV